MLCGQFMNNFDRAMNLLDEKYNFLSSSKQIVSFTSETDKVGLMFFNPFFHFWENFWFLCSANLEIFSVVTITKSGLYSFQEFLSPVMIEQRKAGITDLHVPYMISDV